MDYKISMVALGCAKNRVDGEMLLHTLKEAGYNIVSNPADADIVIVNTCGFIESAKQESIDEILELSQLKKEGTIKYIVATGCLAQRYGEEMMKELYELDAVVGIGANSNIAEIISDVINNKKITDVPEKTLLSLEGGRIQSTPNQFAYLKISEGCDNKCTYCAIPLIRGRFRSRTIENIIDEAKVLAKNGVKELNVIAQDTTRYGQDIYGKLMLPELLNRLCEVDGIEWIRVLYCYPDRLTDELIDVIAKQDKILKYLDLPLQHCSKNILKSMNRHGSKEELTALLNKVREKIPNIVIRTTFIVGFPNETEEDFEQLCEFVKEVKFERMGCFTYSQEEDTPAALFENQIDEDVKEHRQQVLMEMQMAIMDDYSNSLIGKELKVLVEGFDRIAECYFGRSIYDAPDVDGKVFFMSDKKLTDEVFVNVKITDCIDGDLFGKCV